MLPECRDYFLFSRGAIERGVLPQRRRDALSRLDRGAAELSGALRRIRRKRGAGEQIANIFLPH